jgi:uncharacterized protein
MFNFIRSRWLSLAILIAGCLFLNSVGSAVAHKLPKPTSFVTDQADILSTEEEQALESQLSAAASATNGAEVAVVILPSIDDTIENEAQHIFDDWKIGKAELDNGVLFLVAIQQRQVRIHTGYGAETVLTDATAGRILRTYVVPEFKSGNYAAGITAGVNQILAHLANPELANALPQEELSSDNGDWSWLAIVAYFFFFIGVPLLTYLMAFFGRSKPWWPGGVVGALLGGLAGQWLGFLLFGLLGLFLDYILSKNYQRWSLEHKTTSWRKTWGGFSNSSSSSSSHSFGGGSSGGGGSSSSW